MPLTTNLPKTPLGHVSALIRIPSYLSKTTLHIPKIVFQNQWIAECCLCLGHASKWWKFKEIKQSPRIRGLIVCFILIDYLSVCIEIYCKCWIRSVAQAWNAIGIPRNTVVWGCDGFRSGVWLVLCVEKKKKRVLVRQPVFARAHGELFICHGRKEWRSSAQCLLGLYSESNFAGVAWGCLALSVTGWGSLANACHRSVAIFF